MAPYLTVLLALVAAFLVHLNSAGGEVYDLYIPLLGLAGLPWSWPSVALADHGHEGGALILLCAAPILNALVLLMLGGAVAKRRDRGQPT